MKTWVHGRVNREPDLPGQWWLPSDIDRDYCKQIIAEERVEKSSGGAVWKRVSRENHYLDCEAMCFLGSKMLQTRLSSKAKKEKVPNEPPPTPERRIRNARKNARRRGDSPSWRRH